jgi:mucin-19
MFVLNDVHSTVSASVTGGTLSAAGALTIDAENNAVIDAINTSTITASGGSPFTPAGSATGFNVTIASNYVLGSTIASATGSSLSTTAGGNISITALGNASIDAEMDATTTANSSTIGVVLAFNTIGINEPVAGFLEGTVDALFGTDLASENPYTVEAYASDTSISAAGGVSVTATDTADITADISNASLAVPSIASIASTPGIAVGATIALNHIATNVEAYVDQTGSADTVSSAAGDIDIESGDSGTVTSTVVTPVVKIGVSFTQSGASSSIGVSIARNIIESNVSAYDGGRVIGGTDANPVYDNGLALTAHNGNINITSSDTANINATSASAAIALSVTPSAAGGFAGGGAVAINTILGSVIANAQDVALAATTGAANTGDVTVSATDHRQITATVAAVSAQASLGGAKALGAAVALNLIGWRGTVADETQDSNNPIVVQGSVSGGSISAGGAVSIAAASTSLINATTVAASVAIGISLTGGSNSGKQEKNGQEGNVAQGEGGSPTSAEEEGKGATDDAEGGKTATDEGQVDGSKVNEGSDVKGGAETNQAEAGGGAAGESGNTAQAETGASKGSATSIAKGLGAGAGLLIGLGGVVSSSGSGQTTAPTYTTPSSPSATDVVSLTTGQTVQLDSGYAAADYAVGNGSANTTVQTGQVVNDDGTLYRYLGANPLTGVDFSSSTTAPNFTSTTNGLPDWAQIGGIGGDTYQYIGAAGSVDLNNQDYTNAGLWSDITGGSSSGGSGTSSLPLGIATATLGAGLGFLTGGSSSTTPPNTEKGPTDPTGATNPDEPATPKNATPAPEGQSGSAGAAGSGTPGGGGSSLSLSAAGVYTENKIAAHVTASVSNTTSITTGSGASNGLSVTASDTAQINSIDGAASVAGNFSDSKGTSVSIGISIARNTIQDTVAASVVNAGTITALNAPITIEATQGAVIHATSVAAALDVTGASTTGLGVAGGASLADNLIGTNTTATLSGTTVGASGVNHAVGALTVSATDSSTIDADVVAASASLAFAGEGSTAVGIGASLAHNRIGDGTDTGSGAVTASISSSTIYSGAIDVAATSSQTVTATVEAASVAISGGGESGLGVSGAGAFAFNEIAVAVSATIDGGAGNNPTDNITSTGVTVSAADTATIHATVLAGAVGASFGGETATDIAIGVSFARNSISDPVTASISNVPSLKTAGGAVLVSAEEGGSISATSAAVAFSAAVGGEGAIAVAGGGALAANFIEAETQAFISDSNVGASGNLAGTVTVEATDDSAISATIAAIAASLTFGGESGTGVAIGVSLAYNEIGDATGFSSGNVKAYVAGGGIAASGLVSVSAASTGSVNALTVAVAAALSGGGESGISVAGAGVGVFNMIDVGVSAYIDGGSGLADTPTYNVASGGVSVAASDTATIVSTAGAASVSASVAGESAVAAAIGLSIAGNIVDDPVTAYITAVQSLTTSGHAVSVTATENATINAISVAAGISFAGAGESGIAVAGGGATAENLVGAVTSAYVSNSALGASGNLVSTVTVSATDNSTITAFVGAIAGSVAVGGEAGVGVSIGVAYAHNRISDGTESGTGAVQAYLLNTSITGSGLVDVEANAHETVDALTGAAAVTLAGGGSTGVGISGAGVGDINESNVNIQADIQGGSLNVGSVKVAASDTSAIAAVAGAAALSGAIGGSGGIAVSIGISVAENSIKDPVTAYISGVTSLTTTNGGISVLAVENADINALSVAASASLSGGGSAGVAVAGSGAASYNFIEDMTQAYISSATLTNVGGGVTVKATDISSIEALVGAVAVSAAVGGSAGVGVAVGIAVALNEITDGTVNGTGQVKAYLLNTSVNASGVIDVEARSQETINAITEAGAASISGGGAAGIAVSGAGVSDINKIDVNISAYVQGGSTITSGGLTVLANDSSTIIANVGAAAVGAGFGGSAGVAVSIGLSIAQNTIVDAISADVTGVGSLSTGTHAISVTATNAASISATALTASLTIAGGGAAGIGVSGGGALAFNTIGVDTLAYITGSTIAHAGAITVSATESGSITAFVAAVAASVDAGGAAGIGVAIGASIAKNTIQGLAGTTLGAGTGEVFAYISNTPITATGVTSVTATSSETISATVAAGAAAVAGAGVAGVGLSFGGAFGFNTVSVSTRAYVDGNATANIVTGGLNVSASDTATITAGVGAASVGAGIGGVAGVGVSIALSIASNTITDDQQAYITGVNLLSAGTGAVSAEAVEGATINAGAFAASLAGGFAGVAGIAASGAATTVANQIEANVQAYISNSTIGSAGAITVSASNTSSISAVTDAVSAALGGGLVGVGVAVGAAIAQNSIGDGSGGTGEITAYISNTSIHSSGALTVETSSSETIFAEVGTIAAAITGGFVGVSAAGAGASATNDISVNTSAYIQGDAVSANATQKGITAGSVAVSGSDTSTITAQVQAAAVGAAFGAVAATVTIGISLATNQISDDMEVYISGAGDGVTASSGSVDVSATQGAMILAESSAASLAIAGGAIGVAVAGAGAEAENTILDNTNAYISSSAIAASSNVTTSATATATIHAYILAASAAGAGGLGADAGSLGASLAENNIGYTAGLLGVKQADQVRAYTTGSSISAGGAFNETASDTSHIDAEVLTVSAAITIGDGDSLSGASATALNKIAVDDEATVSGSGANGIHVGSVDLAATDSSTITANVAAASLAVVTGLGAAVSVGQSLAQNSIQNIVQASITGATVTTSGALTVDATEGASINATSVAAAVSGGLVGVSGGAAVAINTIGTSTSAFVESSSLTDGGAVSIVASDTSFASATTGTAVIAAGLISFAAGGSAATDTITNAVVAYIDASSVQAGSVTVEASAQPQAVANAYGVTAGDLAVGGSVAIITETPTVTATVGGHITAGSLSIIANVNLPGSGPSANAFAGGSTGGIVAIVASDAETTDHATVNAGIGNFSNFANSAVAAGTIIAVSGALLVVANSNTQQSANGSNASLGLIAVGVAKSNVTATNTTKAMVGSSAQITTGTMQVSANGSDNNFAATTAGAGGVAAGVAVSPTTTDNAITAATIGLGANVNVTGGSITSAFTITAAHLATVDTQVIAVAAGFLSGAGGAATNNINSSVTDTLDGDVTALSIVGHAENDFNHPSLGHDVDNFGGDTAGFVSAAGGTDTTAIAFTTLVDVGSSAILDVVGATSDPGALSLSALNSFQGYDQLTFKTGGAISGASAVSDIHTDSDLAKVYVEAGAKLISVGSINLAADGNANITTQVNTDTYGAVTAAVANSTIDLRPDNEIVIGTSGSNTAATLTAFGNIDALAGEDAGFNMDAYYAHAYVDAYAGALIPINSINAHAYVVQTNHITVNSDATLNTGGNANLMANSVGFANVFAQAKSSSWASDVGNAILSVTGGNPANQFNGTAFSVSHGDVQVDGAIRTGISSNLFVTFGYANIDFNVSQTPGTVTLVNGNVVGTSDGSVYRYLGTGGGVNLSTTNYQDGSLWQIIPGDIVATVSNFATSQGVEILTTGNYGPGQRQWHAHQQGHRQRL